jgi:ubiquinol-cytochrome c reductase cytochrome c subunit
MNRLLRIAPAVALAFLSAALLTFTACEGISTPPTTVDPGGSSSDTLVSAARGAGLYGSLCASCHGDSAEGADGGPGVQGAAGIAGVVRTGVESMPAFPQLTTPQVKSIEAWLAHFVDAGPDTAGGATLYRRHCLSCHGANAEGASPGSTTYQGTGLAAYPQSQDTNLWTAVSQGTHTMPAISGVTQDQAALIGQYLGTFAFPTTGRDLYMRFCVKCHGMDARGTSRYRGSVRNKTGSFSSAVRYGESGMPAYPQITPAGVNLMVSYVLSLP